MAPPPVKKRRLADPGAVVSRRTTRSQKPRLNAELLARVASYSSLGSDLLNLCVVAGPKDCAVIRHAYLRNNLHYLEGTFRKFATSAEDDDEDNEFEVEVELCRSRYLAWMEVNTDWRRLVTAERVDSLVSVYEEDKEGNSIEIINPLLPFNNPAVAIELGLMDPLVHLVEKMGIDINAYQWATFMDGHDTTSRDHLLTISVGSDNFCAFKYLLDRGTIDVCSMAYEGEDPEPITLLEHCFMYPYRTAFFRELLLHPACSLDVAFSSPMDEEGKPVVAHVAIRIMKELVRADLFYSSTWNDNFRLLLSVVDMGARDQSGRDIFQYAKFEFSKASSGSLLQKALKDVLQILEATK